jgi:hypothetical protein
MSKARTASPAASLVFAETHFRVATLVLSRAEIEEAFVDWLKKTRGIGPARRREFGFHFEHQNGVLESLSLVVRGELTLPAAPETPDAP